MTPTHPTQLHLFDANPDPALIPPERRQRLVRLIGSLLREACQDEEMLVATTKEAETVDE